MKRVNNQIYVFLAVFAVIIFSIALLYNPSTTGNVVKGSESQLLAYYPLDGDTDDASGNGKDGINHGAVFITGKTGQAAKFNGISKYIDTNDLFTELESASAFSISLWINPSPNQVEYADVFGNMDSSFRGFGLQQDTTKTNKFAFWYGNDSAWLGTTSTGKSSTGAVIKTINLTANTWTHVIIIKNSTNCTVYINGTLNFTTPCPNNVAMRSSQKLKLGQGYIDTSARYFNGSIDEFRIYSRQLTSLEIQTLAKEKCYLKVGSVEHTGLQDQRMSTLGSAYLCYDMDIYSCKEDYDEEYTGVEEVDNYDQIGSWQCDIESQTWNEVTPFFTRYDNDCNYGSNCGPFEINTSEKDNFNVELWWSYYLRNGSIIDYCMRSDKNKDECDIESTSTGPKKVYASSNNQFYGNIIQNITSQYNGSVEKVILKAAIVKDNQRSNWAEAPIIWINYSTCDNTICTKSEEVQCEGTDVYKMRICGNYDSDPCLEWGTIRSCENGKSCINNACVSGGADSCMNEGGYCLNSAGAIPRNTIQLTTETCPSTGYNCYKCNEADGFTWSTTTNETDVIYKCLKTGCSNNCTGICNYQTLTIENADVNSNMTCCGDGNCFVCNSGFHLYNGTCISNDCLGNLPDSAAIDHPQYAHTFLGPRNFTVGESRTWTYVNVASLLACQWNCNSTSSHRIENSCVEGLAPCETAIGCRNTAVTNAMTINQNCSQGAGYSCYICNSGYNWNETDCINQCPGGCWHNSQCLPITYRMMDGSTRKFCSSGKTMQTQKPDREDCSVNYECESNYCKNGKCVSLVREVSETRAATTRLLCLIRKLFDSQVNCD